MDRPTLCRAGGYAVVAACLALIVTGCARPPVAPPPRHVLEDEPTASAPSPASSVDPELAPSPAPAPVASPVGSSSRTCREPFPTQPTVEWVAPGCPKQFVACLSGVDAGMLSKYLRDVRAWQARCGHGR